MIIDSYKFATTSNIAINLAGYDITRVWAVCKSDLSVTNVAFRIRNTTNSNLHYVFYDDNGEITTSSPVSTTTTDNEGDTINDLITGNPSHSWRINAWRCQISEIDLVFKDSTYSPYLIESGSIKVKNSKTQVRFTGDVNGCLEYGSGLSELGSGNDYSVTSVSHNAVSSSIGYVVNTIETSTDGGAFTQRNDRRSNKQIASFDNGTTTQINVLTSQQNIADQRRLVTTVENGVDMRSYFNTTHQETDSISGNTANTIFRVGQARDSVAPLNGGVQMILIHDAVQSSGEVSSLDGVIDGYFNF